MSRSDVQLDWLTASPPFPTPDGGPAHAGIARWLTDLIGRGDLVPGDRLPREDAFAASLGVSRMTLRQALATLEGKGTLERKSGRLGGTFVREPRIECDLTGMAGFTEQMRRANLRAGARVVSAATVPANAKVAAALSVPRRAAVHEIVRVRTARHEPLAIERSYFPVGPFPDLLDRGLSGSLYGVLTRDETDCWWIYWFCPEQVNLRERYWLIGGGVASIELPSKDAAELASEKLLEQVGFGNIVRQMQSQAKP